MANTKSNRSASLVAVASMLVACLAWSPRATSAAPDAPEIDVLIERISMALGGATGGRRVLDGAAGMDFVFRSTVRDLVTAKETTALHRYIRGASASQRRLDIRIEDGEGKDSATVVDGDAAWLFVDGDKHTIEVGAANSRLPEFAPERMFSVPLALAAEGRQILGDAALQVTGREEVDGRTMLVLSSEAEGEPGARLVVDARTYRPVEVAFRSPAGDIAYRYAEYREVARGLVLPFKREFLRNGVRISSTEVLRFELTAPVDAKLFDPSASSLGKIPTAGAPGKKTR